MWWAYIKSSYGWFNLQCYKVVVFDIRLDLIKLNGNYFDLFVAFCVKSFVF